MELNELYKQYGEQMVAAEITQSRIQELKKAIAEALNTREKDEQADKK